MSHPLNAICPYYTMFPLSFPETVLRRAEPGDWVIDPFCGRGTTNLAARLSGLPSYGIDSNPVAVALARAKTVNVALEAVVGLAETLISAGPKGVPEGAFWEAGFEAKTLGQVCALRDGLMAAEPSAEADFLRALALGALHGPTPKGRPSYFSNQAPRTFAPKPRYSVKFWRERGLTAPTVDVLEVLRVRAERYLRDPAPIVASSVTLGDSRDRASFEQFEQRAKWFVTSPPYYGMKTYEQDQWLRLWFLGGPAEVRYTHPKSQVKHSSPEEFASDLRAVWANLASVAHSEARLAIRFGGINDRSADPVAVLKNSLADSGWRLTTLRSARSADHGKRQLRQFGTSEPRSRPEVDAYCRLAI